MVYGMEFSRAFPMGVHYFCQRRALSNQCDHELTKPIVNFNDGDFVVDSPSSYTPRILGVTINAMDCAHYLL
jgi:hypothetical protein